MNKNKYYNVQRILSNPRPFNFLLGNRNSGKSFAWKKFVIENFLKKKNITPYCCFMFMYRDVEDVDLTAPWIFDDVLRLYFPEMTIQYKKVKNGFGLFYIDGEMAGFACSIKKIISFKKMPILQRIEWAIMDEFLVEDGKYLAREFELVQSLYQTCARGDGMPIRENCYFVFISNTVSMSNPYFQAFPEIKSDFKFTTKFLSRDTFNLEVILNTEAIKAITETRFGQAIEGTKYGEYALNNEFYNDNYKFVEKVGGNKKYMYTITLAGQSFGVWRCDSQGLFYISQAVDKTCKCNFVFDNDDHDVNFIFVQNRESYIRILDRMYRRDSVRFENLECKLAFLTLTGLIK